MKKTFKDTWPWPHTSTFSAGWEKVLMPCRVLNQWASLDDVATHNVASTAKPLNPKP